MGKSKSKKSKGNCGGGGHSSSPSPFRVRGGPSGSEYGSRGGLQTHQGRETCGSSFLPDELDFTLKMYADSSNPPPASYTVKEYKNQNSRGRGRGGRSYNPNYRGSGSNFRGNGRGRADYSTSRQPDNTSSRGRGRGRGQWEDKGYNSRRGRGLGASADSTPTKSGPKTSTLSNLLYDTRPLLKPIGFVRAEQNPFLFQKEEDILQPIAEEAGVDEASYVPTADRIARIFSGASGRFDNSDSSSSSEPGEEEIEEVDFNDMGRLFDPPNQNQSGIYQNREVDFNVEISRNLIENGNTDTPRQPPSSSVHTASYDSATEHPLFIVDTQPAPLPSSLNVREPELPAEGEDEEIIVYVAPHPKISSRAPSRMQEPSIQAAYNAAETPAFVPYTPSATLSLASNSLRNLSPPPSPQLTTIPESLSVPKLPSSSKLEAPPTEVSSATSLTIASVHNLKFEFPPSRNGSTISGVGRQLPSLMTPRMTKRQKAWEIKRTQRRKARKNGRRVSLAVFGAMVDDARLYDDEDVLFGDGKDSKWEHRRRGDSDVEWGTENEDGQEDEVSKVAVENAGLVKSEKAKGKEKALPEDDDVEADHGMLIDSEIDVSAMKSFVGGLMGRDAGVHVTMEDLHIEERIKAEDEDGASGGAEGSSDDDIEGIFDLEERLMIGDSDEVEDDDGSDDEVDLTPKSSFQTRLDRLRAKSRSYKAGDRSDDNDETDDNDGLWNQNLRWAEEEDDDDDESLIARIDEILEENADILQARSRKERKLFNAVQNGDLALVQPARKRKDQWKDTPKELREAWERDRQAKAERKREREHQKLITSIDPLSKKKGGKKGRNTMLKASRLDPDTINLGPNRVIDFTTLVQQIRRFVSNLDGPESMSLPPANKWTRKNIHEVALAFGLKSGSKGVGDSRYTTLTKTTSTGRPANERKIASIMRRFGPAGARDDDFEFGGGLKGQRGKLPKHREGDEVGGSAPKIGQSNLGFKMLASMGWAEGERIGLSGGLEAPLVAIIKHSKLGLGAMK